MRMINRRNFLKTAAVTGALAFGAPAVRADVSKYFSVNNRKLIIVLFGGGTRCSETIDDPEHRYIPHLFNEMIPKGTLFTNMRIEHKVVHPNSTGSIKTGHWEWDDIDWSRPVANPTIFEIYRKIWNKPDTSTWSFVYASILAKTGYSLAKGYGTNYAANIVIPPTIPRSTAVQIDSIMHKAVATGSTEVQLEAIGRCTKLTRSTSRIDYSGLRSKESKNFLKSQYSKWMYQDGTTSHDNFLADRAIACMQTFKPTVITVDFGEIDCAHYGSWSRYVEAIHRTDELTWRLWQAANSIKDYRNKTLMLILPDHGRQLDRPGNSGFIHHSNFYTNQDADEGCRRVWMLAFGPNVKPGWQIDRPVPITSVAATGLEYLGLEKSKGAEPSVLNLIV